MQTCSLFHVNAKKLEEKYRPESISSEFQELFTYAWVSSRRQYLDDVASSKAYVKEFYKWLKQGDARSSNDFKKLIEAVTETTYVNFGKWQSDGSPQTGEKPALCFGASAQFHRTRIEEHFAKFLNRWIAFRKNNSAPPDFSEYEKEIKKLRTKYRLIPNDRYPFVAQLQRYLHAKSFERKVVFNDIENFIDTHPSGYIIIEGGAGMGKSWLTAYTAKTLYDSGQYQCIWHFNELASGHNRSSDLLRTIFPQLKDIYPCLEDSSFNFEYERALNLSSGYAAFYKTIFDQLAYDEKFLTSKLIIFVDALDEVNRTDISRQDEANTLFLPQSLVKNIFIVITSRNFERETYLGNKFEISLSETGPYQKSDAEEFIRARAKDKEVREWIDCQNWTGSDKVESFVKFLVKKSGCSFIYLYYVFRDIRQFETINELPNGINEYYDKQIQRICYDHSICKAEVFLILDAIYRLEPCIMNFIKAYTEVDKNIIVAVCNTVLSMGLVSREKVWPNFRIYSYSHQSFSDFLENHEEISMIADRAERVWAVCEWMMKNYSSCSTNPIIINREEIPFIFISLIAISALLIDLDKYTSKENEINTFSTALMVALDDIHYFERMLNRLQAINIDRSS